MLVKFFLTNILQKNIIFCCIELRRTKEIIRYSRKPSDGNWVRSTLGALGSSFESCRADSYIPIHTIDFIRFFFFTSNT